MKSVAIVGLNPWGLALARFLKQFGWEVKGTKRTFEGVESMRLQRLETYLLELTPEINADPDDLTALFDVDALIINIPPSRYFFRHQDYVAGIQNLISEALLHNVSHFIFLSSPLVFGQNAGTFDENSPTCPSDEAGKALCEIEQAFLQFNDIDCDILRLGEMILDPQQSACEMAGQENLANGLSLMNFTKLNDSLRAIYLLLETPSGARLYHLISPEHPTRQAFFQSLCQNANLPVAKFDCTEMPLQKIVRADKICQELDFIYE